MFSPALRGDHKTSTIRKVEAEVGVSRTVLHDFAEGGKTPQSRTLRKLERWAREKWYELKEKVEAGAL